MDDLRTDNLKKAVEALNKSINDYDKNKESELSETLRSGVIHNFETAYEVCWKFMQRLIEVNLNLGITKISKKEFYRVCAENELISDVRKWWFFNESRNKTSHVYLDSVAEEVLAAAYDFLPEAVKLIKTVEEIK